MVFAAIEAIPTMPRTMTELSNCHRPGGHHRRLHSCMFDAAQMDYNWYYLTLSCR